MLGPCLRNALRGPGSRPWPSGLSRIPCRFASTTSIPASSANTSKNKWSSTLMLPKTDFPMKHKDPVKAELQSRELITTELIECSGRRTRARCLCCMMVRRMRMVTCTWVRSLVARIMRMGLTLLSVTRPCFEQAAQRLHKSIQDNQGPSS